MQGRFGFVLKQLRPTRGPIEGLVRPRLGFSFSKITCPYFDNPEFHILMQLIFSAT